MTKELPFLLLINVIMSLMVINVIMILMAIVNLLIFIIMIGIIALDAYNLLLMAVILQLVLLRYIGVSFVSDIRNTLYIAQVV